jgi:hypothetical protein
MSKLKCRQCVQEEFLARMQTPRSTLQHFLVSLCNGDGNVVDGKPPLPEEVFAHVGEGGRRVNGVPAHPVPLQVGSRVAALKATAAPLVRNNRTLTSSVSYSRDDDSGDADAHLGALEQLVPEVDAVPEGHEVPLDLDVVSTVQPAQEQVYNFSATFM